MRRRHGGGQDPDSPRVNFDMVVQSNRASRHRTAQQAADSFWGMPPPPRLVPLPPTPRQVAQAVRQDELVTRQRQNVARLPLGFNPGQYRDEQRQSPLARAAEALITTPPSARPAMSDAGLPRSSIPVMSDVDVWLSTELTPSPRPSSLQAMHERLSTDGLIRMHGMQICRKLEAEQSGRSTTGQARVPHAAQQGYEPTTSAGGNAGGRQTGGQSGVAETAGSIRPGCSQTAGEGQAQQGYEPTTSAGGNAGGRQTGGQSGVAEAAGSIRPGCSQDGRRGAGTAGL